MPKSEKLDYFSLDACDVNDSMSKLHLQSPLLTFDSADYFSNILLAHTKGHTRGDSGASSTFSKPKWHKNAANSILSLTSDSTAVGDSSISLADLSLSTDTLIEECSQQSSPSKRKVVLLKLNVPRRSFQQPLSSTFPLAVREPLYEYDEEEPKKCASATTPSFNFPEENPFTPVASSFRASPLKQTNTTPLSLSGPLFNAPVITKHPTQPNLHTRGDFVASIKSEQIRRLSSLPVQENLRESIVGLSNSIKYITRDEAMAVLRARHIVESTKLHSVLVIDIRPFADFLKGHITGSINVCLPLTLLKRANFNFSRCMNSLPTYEKTIFQNYMHHYPLQGDQSMPPILVYDAYGSSSNIYHMCKKLVDGSCWDTHNGPTIYLIDEPFTSFTTQADKFIDTGKEKMIDIDNLAVKPQTIGCSGASTTARPSLTIDTTAKRSPLQQRRSQSLTGVPVVTFQDVSTPVSNFKLPQSIPLTKFKIRHNEEVFESMVTPVAEEFSLSKVTEDEMKRLPPWLQAVEKQSSLVTEEFNKLERCEKDRLNGAFSFHGDKIAEVSTPGGSTEPCPQINCGLDYGHKNRYKDIFLFDHSRVRLTDGSRVKSWQHGCDYINASYLDPVHSLDKVLSGNFFKSDLGELRYIATQGPLRETIGDFWKCVINQKCLLIISLSGEVENGVHKCSPFWEAGIYRSGENVLRVELEGEETYGNLVLRSFKVRSDCGVSHRALQIHLCNWADMSSSVDCKDLMDLVTIKRNVLGKIAKKSKYHTITHCSAGCGRTGVFCAVDTIIDLSKYNGGSFNFPQNPVYHMVNNLRRQRVLMVQTMRQYYLIYDTLVYHVLHDTNEHVENLKIVNDFISSVNEGEN